MIIIINYYYFLDRNSSAEDRGSATFFETGAITIVPNKTYF